MSLPKNVLFSFSLFLFQFLFSSYFVRVCIKCNVKSFYLSAYEKPEIFLQYSSKKVKQLKIRRGVSCNFVPPDKIQILGKTYSLPIKLYSVGKIKIDKNIYPGEIEVFSKDAKTVCLVNIVNIETYLYGVVPYEVEPSWTNEMLKVQSIIARTYALTNLDRHKKEGFDFCSTVHCQVYKGISKTMRLRIKRAVDSTKGLVVVDKDSEELIPTYYHAACGGCTENVSEIWPQVQFVKTLSSVKCNFCKNSPYYSWEATFSQDIFVKKLKMNDYNVGNKIKDIIILTKTQHNRVKNLQIIGDKDKFEITGEILRKIFGYNKIKSTKIYKIEFKNNKIIFYGNGWGHGVGLCQWGANELTKQKRSFKEVIKYYYPNTTIKKWY